MGEPGATVLVYPETSPNEKAEISTKCATRTIAVAPLRSSGR